MRSGKKGIGILIALVAGISITIFSANKILTVMGEEKPSITFGEFSGKTAVEDSVLFIGTHLIHIQSMTDTLYETALESASDAEQSKVYYKSELAGGAWFDITDALGISDITEEGIIVTQEEMKDLVVEYYTFKDGITRSALTGNAINIFNIKEPYNLYELEELEQLKQQFEEQFSAEDTGVKKYYYDQLKSFFEQDVRNNITTECDAQINGLQSLYTSLVTEEKKELAEIVVKLMEKVDSKRRAEVLYMLSQAEDHLLNKLQEVCTGSEYDKEEYILLIEIEESTEEETSEEETSEEEKSGEKNSKEEKEKEYREEREQFVENSGVLDAIASALQSCQTSYTNHVGNSLDPGTTVIKNLEYERSLQVIQQSGGGSEGLIEELELLFNIQDNIVGEEEQELSLIEAQLLPAVEEKYKGQVGAGAGEGYKVAVANGVSQAAIEQTLTTQKTSLNTVLQELEFIISAQTKRQAPEEALNGIYDRLDGVQGLKTIVKKDAFEAKALESIEEYRIWLMEKAKAVIEENEELASEMDQLEETKEELMTEYQQALDENDLAGAKKKMAMMEVIDEQIRQKQEELQSIIDDPDSTSSEKAKAIHQAGGSTLLNQIEQLKQEALLNLAEGSQDIGASLDALAALGAEDALNEIAQAAKEGGKEQLAEAAQKAATESKESDFHGDNRNETAGSLEEAKVRQQVQAYYGKAFEELNQDKKAEVITALDMLIKDGYISLKDLFEEYYGNYLDPDGVMTQSGTEEESQTDDKTEEQEENTKKEDTGEKDNADNSGSEGSNGKGQTGDHEKSPVQNPAPGNYQNAAVFDTLRGQEGKYAPLSVVAGILDYRYIFDDTKKEVTLSKGSKVYRIRENDTQIWVYPEQTNQLHKRPVYQKDIYLGEEDLLTCFGCRVLYLEKTNTGICLTEKQYEEAEEFYKTMTEGDV